MSQMSRTAGGGLTHHNSFRLPSEPRGPTFGSGGRKRTLAKQQPGNGLTRELGYHVRLNMQARGAAASQACPECPESAYRLDCHPNPAGAPLGAVGTTQQRRCPIHILHLFCRPRLQGGGDFVRKRGRRAPRMSTHACVVVFAGFDISR